MPEPAEVQREVLTWEGFGEASCALAEAVVADGYRPDVVLAVARGGLTVAGGVAYALGVKNCFAVNVEYCTGVDQRLDVPVFLPPVPNPVDLRDLRVLVADDVADTGHTLQQVLAFCAGHVAEVRSAVLYEKPWSVLTPEYVWRRTEAWITFPWSARPPVPYADGATGAADASDAASDAAVGT